MIKKQREKQYAVFGLGRFGTSVALTLNELGYQVMGVDTDEDNVQRLAHELTHVVTADSSDERTLRSLGAQNFDVAVVAIGDLEANLLLKEIGVPVVVVKAINQVHGKMLKKIGADKIVYSERDMGQRVAHNLISNSIVDYIELSDTISLMSITVPPSLAGKNLIESNLRSRYNVNIVAIKHGS
ncbi:potassium channel family protein, partial [Phascolarctobacterium faecium]|uniref:potassium channel family protein n=1 Tax=Phascolarctobacterium faecium TaxID=33025 RepID=UPI003FD7E714